MNACLSPLFVIPSPIITHESLMAFATVRILKSLCERSQRVFKSNIWPSTKRNACSELSLVVEEPTIIPAAFGPCPPTLKAVLADPPKVPKSVTV